MRPLQQRSPWPSERFALAILTGALRAALGSAAIGMTLAAPAALAAEPSAGAQHHAIAAGPLSDVLAQYAAATGVQLVFEPALLADRRSAGLQGRYTEAEGFAQLLRGSGYEAVRQGQTGYVLRRSATPVASTTTLDAVTVTAAAVPSGTTEGSGSYAARSSSTSSKLNLSQRETPQTLTVITREQLDDAGLTTVDDALRAVSGVFALDGGSIGSNFYSRGFSLQAQVDGMNTPAGIDSGNRSPLYDTAFVDRVEVLQGAAGLLTGAGSPGGTVNMVLKRPTSSFQAQAEVQVGSWNERRVVGDVSTPLTESGHVRGRLVALADKSDSFTDYVYRDRQALYGIVEADLTSTTTLSASVLTQKDESRGHFGVPFAANGSDAGLSRSSFWGDADHRSVRDYTIYTVGLTQQLGDEWSLKANYSWQKTDNDIHHFSSLSGGLNPATGAGLSIGSRQTDYFSVLHSNVVDVYASGPFELLGRRHELTVGLNGTSVRDENNGTGYSGATPINVNTFDPAALGPIRGGTPSRAHTKTRNLGMYGVARWSLTDALKLITGVRVSDYRRTNVVTGAVSPQETGEVTPYAGLVYDINAQYSAYASYSDIMNPQANRSKDGEVLQPVTGKNYELGVKGELLDKRLNVSAAVFHLAQSGLAVVDDSVPNNPSNACGGRCYTAAGKVVSQGLDLGVNGQIRPGLNLAAGYTYTSAEYIEGPQKDQRFRTEQPRHSLRVAANYQLPGTQWSVGGNVAATGRSYKSGGTGAAAWTIEQGSLVLLGLQAKYRITPQTQLNLAVSNLADRSYRHLYGREYAPYGEPRKFTASLRHDF
ncbi:TonB-dependent siderophore receptor [Comamonas endophytica]|uniref:TonB-dependent receptor n=1 Tax=Comamonas endophytica TaxID=2949090 RepID=A0ABY6G8X0_9BURK|nr:MULTISPECIES: TonB-dependent receptor [unclassified Acidovorax]MCD2511451.1 TonB-dependent receptor [Acidovorax sp. D4N7]UYG50842.1 TonB-dependent receptor [Acidovorax sp. 5MLIR]